MNATQILSLVGLVSGLLSMLLLVNRQRRWREPTPPLSIQLLPSGPHKTELSIPASEQAAARALAKEMFADKTATCTNTAEVARLEREEDAKFERKLAEYTAQATFFGRDEDTEIERESRLKSNRALADRIWGKPN